MRMINKDELIAEFDLIANNSEIGEMQFIPIKHIKQIIDNAPTVELFCSYLSDGEVKQPCVEGPCEHARPQGEWLYPYADNIIGKRRIGRSWRVCSVCKESFTNNIPWNANFCPNCGAEIKK